jgi:hypothetical protein
MCLVHSADGRRPGHLAGGMPVHSVGRQYAHAAACATLFMTRALPRKQRGISILYALWILWHSEITLAWLTIVYSLHFSHGPTCRGSTPLYVRPLSYKREGTRRYKTSTLSRSLRLSDSQVHTSSQDQYNTKWSRVLRSGGPNHSKPWCVLVFIIHLASRQNA